MIKPWKQSLRVRSRSTGRDGDPLANAFYDFFRHQTLESRLKYTALIWEITNYDLINRIPFESLLGNLKVNTLLLHLVIPSDPGTLPFTPLTPGTMLLYQHCSGQVVGSRI